MQILEYRVWKWKCLKAFHHGKSNVIALPSFSCQMLPNHWPWLKLDDQQIPLKKVRLSSCIWAVLFSYRQRSFCDSRGILGEPKCKSSLCLAAQPTHPFLVHIEAMSIVECLKRQTFSQAQEEQTSTEGKAGVPRFDGEVTKLEYFSYGEAELKKLSALGLRLIDGLKGPALQVERGLHVDKFSTSKQAGGKGSIPSWSTARWHPQPSIRRKHSVVFSQTTDLVCNDDWPGWRAEVAGADTCRANPAELRHLTGWPIADRYSYCNQRWDDSRCSVWGACGSTQQDSWEGELYKGHAQGKGKGDRRPWPRAYTEEDGPEIGVGLGTHTPNGHGGYEDYENWGYYGEDEAPMEDDKAICEVYAVMVEQGLDEENVQALEYAAEIQAESEVVFLWETKHIKAVTMGFQEVAIFKCRAISLWKSGRPEFRPWNPWHLKSQALEFVTPP